MTRTHLCTFLFRTDALRAIEGFRPWFVTAEDIDTQLRFGQAHRVWYDPTPAYAYRLHGASITHTQADVARQFYEAQARHFLQQRVEQGRDDLQRGTPPAPPVNGKGNAAPISTAAHVQGMLVGESWRQHRAGQKGKSLVTWASPALVCCERLRVAQPRRACHQTIQTRITARVAECRPRRLALLGSGTLENAAQGKPPGRPVGIGCPAAELHSAFWTNHILGLHFPSPPPGSSVRRIVPKYARGVLAPGRVGSFPEVELAVACGLRLSWYWRI